MKGEKYIEKLENNINYKINIDKIIDKYYNESNIATFTYKDYMKYCNIVNKLEETIEILRKILKRVKTNEERKILKNIINLTLKDQLGEETCNKLEKEMGDEENMLAVVEMLERENKKIFLDGRKEGRNEGILVGAKNTIKTIVEKMLEKNMPIEEIKEITKMSEKEILKLKKK